MPTFCRHNRLVQNCPICSQEQSIELRPLISSSAPRASQPRARTPSQRRPATAASSRQAGGRGDVTVRRLARGADDGYRSPLLMGLKSSADAERLAGEIAFAATRIRRLADDPPGLYAEAGGGAGDLEERTWLAFLIAYLCPLQSDDPFASIQAARTSWAGGELPELDQVQTGPRTAYDPSLGTRTLEAYRAWAARPGSQAAAFAGDASWTPKRRFARVFERLALPGLHRDARYDLLVTLGRLGLYELEAGSLQFGGDNEPTLAAKRMLGIGDSLLLERRAAELAQACDVPLDALDLAFYNWGRAERATLGVAPGTEPDEDLLSSCRAALGVN
jgi:hypothetical protein